MTILYRHDLSVFIVIDPLILAAHCPHDIGNANTLHKLSLSRYTDPRRRSNISIPPNVLDINEYFATF